MKKSIVINRQYGSGGRVIGQKVAEQLHMPYFDSNILSEAAQDHGIDVEKLKDFDEKLMGSLLYNIAAMTTLDEKARALPYDMYRAISDTIYNTAMKEPTVFVGRCADQVLKEHGLNYLNVFVYASDMEERKRRAINVDGVEENYAEAYIYKKDRARAKYQKFFTNTEFGKFMEYDVCLNSSALGYDKCADMIVSAVR